MAEGEVITFVMREGLECNLSYMPFIAGGGLFVPTTDPYKLGDEVLLDLTLPGKTDSIRVEGKVVWITPKNALHHVLPGIGIQFIGANSSNIKAMIESQLDNKVEIGGYTYGITDETRK